MALTIAIEGKGVIANCDALTNDTGGTGTGDWSEQGGGTMSLSTDVYLFGGSCISGQYASKSGFQQFDLGAGNELDFTATTGTESGQLLYIWVAMTALGTLDTLANYGLCVRLSSSSPGTTNYIDYLIAGNDGTNGWAGGFKCFVIDPTKTPSRVSGTQSSIIAAVRTVGIWIDCSTSARADSIFIDQLAVGSGIRVTGTSTSGWSDVVSYCTDYTSRAWGMFQEREGIYYSYGKTYIGDATSQTAAVSFADNSRIIQFGYTEYYTGSVWASSVPLSFNGIVIEDHTSYTTTFDDGIIVGSDQGRNGSVFLGDAYSDVSMDLYGGNNAGSLTRLYGTTMVGLTGAINMGNDAQHLAYSVTFDQCSQFDPVGAPVIRNCNFINTADVDAALLWNENINIAACNFISNTAGAGIEMPSAAGTPYTYTSLLFSGNTNDVLNSSGSAITVNKSGTPAANPTSYEGSAVTFQASTTITITVQDEATNAIVGAQVAIYRTSDRVQIMNELTIAGGIASEAYTGATGGIEIRIRKASTGTKYVPYSTLGTLDGSSTYTLLVTLLEDLNA